MGRGQRRTSAILLLLINFCQAKSRSQNLRHNQLHADGDPSETRGRRKVDVDAVCSFRCCEEELRQLDRLSLTGNRIRSRIPWLEKGDKVYRFFLLQEKRRGRKSSIMELQDDDDDDVAHKTPSSMLKLAATFYDHL